MRINAMPIRAVIAVPTACTFISFFMAGSTGAGIPIIMMVREEVSVKGVAAPATRGVISVRKVTQQKNK